MVAVEKLKAFALLDSLSQSGLAEVAARAQLRRLRVGDILFRQGKRDDDIHFLLEGSLSLAAADQPARFIHAGSNDAQRPVSRLKPRRFTAAAATAAIVLTLNEDWLDDLLTADQSRAYEVSLIEGEDPEWLFQLFNNPLFAQVPRDNMAALCERMRPMRVKNGQTILNQGEAGDYYYVIRQGRARVMRSFRNNPPTEVALLGSGEGFGEEALLSGEPRNATVQMCEDGMLMRLAQTDFNELLRPALVKRVDPRSALVMVKNGAAFLDVRTEAEFREFAIPDSQNLPLCNLRYLSEKLDRKRKYITVCQTGRRCAVAAFLLNQRGFEVYVLRDGLDELSLDPAK
jgi:CRP-like cAMP-binding protein